jgi:hypothetical protein
VATTDAEAAALLHFQQVNEEREAALPLHEQINHAYDRSTGHAVEAVYEAVRTGNLLIRSKSERKHGEWLPWLEANCPKLCQTTAKYLMQAALYAQSHAYVDFSTVRQLFLAAGAIKPADAGDDETKGPKPLPTILTPLQRVFETMRMFYTDERIAALNADNAPHVLNWVRKGKAELVDLESRLVKRFGDKKVEVEE